MFDVVLGARCTTLAPAAETTKSRCMYVVGREHPDRFLDNRRATVAEYADYISDRVEIVDLREVVPSFTA